MKKLAGILLCAFVCAAGCRSLAPVHNITDKTVVVAEHTTLQDAILSAGALKHWDMQIVRPGLIRADLFIRSHEVSVDIAYTDSSYSITYVSSKNMKYKEKKNTIHPKYNQWIRNLNAAIMRQARVPQL